MTKHFVFGAGLIGCYLGGVLSACRNVGDNAVLYMRHNMADRLTHGMTLTDYQNNRIVLPELSVRTSLDGREEAFDCDFLWLTVKCISVADAISDIKKVISPNTVILCCQNGLGSEKLVSAAFPNNVILRVMVPFNVVVESDDHFHRGSEGHLTIESSKHNEWLSSSLTADNLNSGEKNAILPIAFTEDMTSLQWAKLQLNLGNSVNALANIPVKSMLEQRKYRLIIAAMMKELLKVTDAIGVQLPKVTSVPAHWIPVVLSLPNFLFSRVATKMLAIDPKVRTSMWWDIEQGRKTEVDFLNGVVVDYAKQNGIECKVNQSIIKRVKIIETEDPQERRIYTAETLAAELELS